MITLTGSLQSRMRNLATLSVVCVVFATLGTASASADFGIASFDGSTTSQDGSPATQAGAHPFEISTTIQFNTVAGPFGPEPDDQVKDIAVDLPAGLIGNPQALPKCTAQQLGTSFAGLGCPPDSQVGTATVNEGAGQGDITTGVYNMVPPPGEPAAFGFSPTLPVQLDAAVRPGSDGALTITSSNVSNAIEVNGTTVTFWGVPADPSHDGQRGPCLLFGGSCPSTVPVEPFLTNPVNCSAGPLTTTMQADSWEHPGEFKAASFVSHDSAGNPVAITGCNKLSFKPTVTVQPDTSEADAPAGLAVDLKVPQTDNPIGLAAPELRNATVVLPRGMTVSPSAADGLEACSPTEVALGSNAEPTCPNGSKLGTVKIVSPLVDQPLEGSIYLAQPTPTQLLRVYLVAAGDGVLIKLAGDIAADPESGQLRTTFTDAPELPFSDLQLVFFGGPRAALATPSTCGTFTTTSDLKPWSAPGSGPDATPSDSFSITSGCNLGFAPALTAGIANPVAGASSPFLFRLTREDRDQTFSRIMDVKLPSGLLASIKGVPLCSDTAVAAAAAHPGTAEKASPSCPAGSQIGTVQTGAGPGSHPFYLPGKVYLTGAYKGAPYGLAIVVPALAGPFDLGTVVVRAAVNVDPRTAQLSVDTDPLPTILQGIPLQLRDIALTIDRPGFMRAPTNCVATHIAANAMSTTGTVAALESRFQVGGCAELAFSPKLRLKLSGRRQTTDGKHPTLSATITQPPRQANIKAVRVGLPLALALDPDNSQHVCGYQAGQHDQCPADTIVGHATAVTPLLNRPLTGPVYLVQGIRFDSSGRQHRTLPTLLLPLRGELSIDLRAQSKVVHEKLVTTFESIPDAQISRFDLTINGGRRGILVVTHNRNLCADKQVAGVLEAGQNGKVRHVKIRIATPCSSPAKHHSRRLAVPLGRRSLP